MEEEILGGGSRFVECSLLKKLTLKVIRMKPVSWGAGTCCKKLPLSLY